MLDETFWNPEENHLLSTEIREFFKDELLFSGFNAAELGALEMTLFKLFKKIKESIYSESYREHLREDVSDKIEEWCGTKGEYILSLFPFDKIDRIVERWKNELSESGRYWELFWENLNNVLEEDYQLSSLEYYSKPKIKEYLQYRFKQNGRIDKPLSAKEYFKAKKKGVQL